MRRVPIYEDDRQFWQRVQAVFSIVLFLSLVFAHLEFTPVWSGFRIRPRPFTSKSFLFHTGAAVAADGDIESWLGHQLAGSD